MPATSAVLTQLRSSSVTYLAGELDTDTADPSLDTGCAARWQGPQRLARAQAYQKHLDAVLGPESAPHPLITVPAVGHSASGMFTSAPGVKALFPG